MKVGTDGVLLGAWADVVQTESVLDVGTGSGLIALMIAQRCSAFIEAIDIDEGAVVQAEINAKLSPWYNRIKIVKADLKKFTSESEQKFDLLVSNPPYFKNSLHTPDKARTEARHAVGSFHNEIILSAKKLLNPQGRLCMILPVAEGNDCVVFALQNGMFCSKKVCVFPKPGSEAKRLLLEFKLVDCETEHTELLIESGKRHEYSEEFTALVKDFYLKL